MKMDRKQLAEHCARAVAEGAKVIRVNPAVIPAKKTRKELPAYCCLIPGPGRGRWEVRIPEFHPATLNQLMGMHHMAAARLKLCDAQIIGQALRQADVPRAAGKRRAQFVIVMGPGQRKPDPDAFFKSGLDALKRCGALVDDNPTQLDLMPVIYERQSVKATRVILEDVA